MASTTAQRDRRQTLSFRKSVAAGTARWLVRIFAFVTVIGLVSACATLTRSHGYVPSDEDLALLEIGTDTRETTAPKVGRPSASGLLNDTGWFYVQSRWEYRGALAPREIDRQVVALTFSDTGVLQNVERFGLERGQIVPLSRRVTESSVRGQTILTQLFSSFGRVGAGQLLAD